MQKTKTCRLTWPNFTTFLPISKPSIINQANKTTFYNTKCQTKARRDINQKHKVIHPMYYKHLKNVLTKFAKPFGLVSDRLACTSSKTEI